MTKKPWEKPELSTLDVDQTLIAQWKNWDETFSSFKGLFGTTPSGS